jgi:hypothetical protein
MKITLYGHGCIVAVTLDEERLGVAYDGAGTLYEYAGVGCWMTATGHDFYLFPVRPPKRSRGDDPATRSAGDPTSLFPPRGPSETPTC